MSKNYISKCWKRFTIKLAAALTKPLGFFIPHSYVNIAYQTAPTIQYLLPFFEQAKPRFIERLDQLSKYETNFARFQNATPPTPRWQQDWFPGLDGAIAYTLIRDLNPTTVIEIGSGHSTRFMMQAIVDGNHLTNFYSIDPSPRADIRMLVKNNKKFKWYNKTIQEMDITFFSTLKKHDVLFIDSSHILMPGSDVDIILSQILPFINQGVYVHFHDIFMPDPYPLSWQWRGYNEQNALIGLIAQAAHNNTKKSFEIEWASSYIRNYMLTKDCTTSLPSMIASCNTGVFESSIWLKKL